MSSRVILALDQGTSGTTALLVDADGRVVARGYAELTQYYPQPGWVEHDPEEIWTTMAAAGRQAMAEARVTGSEIAAVGITNQRETTIVWERSTGAPIHHAIVWQCRRTAAMCEALKAEGAEPLVRERTGLVVDAYFSGTKIAWLLDHVPWARKRAERGELAFGTVDSWLVWKLTGGRVHVTDATNASRTLCLGLRSVAWDDEMLARLTIPREVLPTVVDSSGPIAETSDLGWLPAGVPIAGIAGDQQAALIGQACFQPGMAKSTYGTGCFLLLNTGEGAVTSANRLLTTPAYRIGGRIAYALEGSIFVAGAAVKWLRDGLKIIESASQTATLAAPLPYDHGVYLVPAFVGLGAPHWAPNARALLCGLTFNASAAHLARATLESVAYQTLDLTEAMQRDGAQRLDAIRIDGGMAANDWFCQFLADILHAHVERPAELETTALGAAFLAGLATGVWPDLASISGCWCTTAVFEPAMNPAQRAALVAGWREALARTLHVAR